ncbi:non-specific lipid-transfer protein 1-like [Benincasa hispida]|uniref:non-specific lipid-transfer protein 1-like n=1 Tax=Benincasa hispida TaxID=102211 RepID=UPI00190206C3|nr:non-specific lipid-transfer protein 1-like [Benincasa hispida]
MEMERSMKVMMIVGVVMMCMVVSEAAISCGAVAGAVGPCIGYLKAPTGIPPPACCNGVRNLKSQASTPADRRAACYCLKNAANSIRGIDVGAAAGLPSKCGVSIPYKISPNTDCTKVN